MRVWDVHPGYLSRNSLLGQHGEIHAVYRVIQGGKKGYSNHPETLRWQGHLHKLKAAHDLTAREMQLRGFRHHTPMDPDNNNTGQGEPGLVDPLVMQFELLGRKYQIAETCGRIPLPHLSSEIWRQHKYSVMARGNNCCREVLDLLDNRSDLPINRAQDLIKLIHGIMARQVMEEALAKTAEQIWSDLEDDANSEEKHVFVAWPAGDFPGLISFLYTLAIKHNRRSVLQSTIFSDI